MSDAEQFEPDLMEAARRAIAGEDHEPEETFEYAVDAIPPSREDAVHRAALEDLLNGRGAEGWRLRAVTDLALIFERPME